MTGANPPPPAPLHFSRNAIRSTTSSAVIKLQTRKAPDTHEVWTATLAAMAYSVADVGDALGFFKSGFAFLQVA